MTLLGKTTAQLQSMEDAHAHDSWKEWFQLNGPKLLLCARQWTRSLADAEDVVQEAFVRYWRHQRPLDQGNPMGLLVTSIRRAAFDLGRRNARRAAREEYADAPEPLFATGEGGEDRRRAIEAALRALPEEQREVLILKIWGELTFDAIGQQLAISPNTAASRYRYALAALREKLAEADGHG